MANENINAGELKEIASVNARLSGNAKEFNDIVRESITSLKMMAKSYDNILSKIDNMNKGTINTKRINRELEKSNARAAVAKNQMVEAERRATADQINRANVYEAAIKAVEDQKKKLQREINIGDAAKIAQEKTIMEQKFRDLDLSKEQLQAEDLKIIALREAYKIAEKLSGETEDRLLFEKSLEKSLGKTGMLIGIMSKRLGLFKDTYAKIVEEAREGNSTELKKVTIFAAVGAALYGVYKLAGKIGGKLLDGLKSLAPEGGGPVSKMTDGISKMLGKIPLLGPLFSGLLEGFSAFLDIVIATNDTIVKAGRNLGLNTAQATKLYRTYADIAYQTNNIFITSKRMMEAQVELSQALGVNNLLSKEILATNIELKDIAGLEAGLIADMAQNSRIAGLKSSKELVNVIGAQVKGLQRATGISLTYQSVLAEANSLGGYLGLAFAKYPDKISKALVTTKALGTSLKDMDAIADSFLDFESSISKEFEAQLLTGKDINLQEARRLFLNNDLAGAAMQLNKQLGSSDEFLNMNRISATSIAESFGMSRDQLGDMLKKQELLSKLGAKDTDNARTQLKLGLERYKTQEALSAKLGEDVYNNLVNASTQERISALLNKIKTSVVDFIERSNLIDKIQRFVDYLSNPKNLKGILNTIKNIVAGAVSFFGDLFALAADIASVFARVFPMGGSKLWEDRANNIRAGAASAAESIRAVGVEPVTVSGMAVTNQAAAGGFTAPRSTQSANQNMLAPNVNVSAYLSIDGDPIPVKVIGKAQDSAPMDNPQSQYFSINSYSLSGQSHK